ncbi:hypothetical protein [Leuconostoc gasicomitatum]|uniref:hypothetical protein n=1 Tax=Leuconostoc gasicomitatum TaxID=115778 RepID=UPI001CC72362|nr:hypothetical protein [Leuconostoc gasicomitatum]MBZ5946338.1 hypothetical protein [Leuconostoc gasicomitatum]MBZ5950163.1 hypothetical protein [Leuconostoc gasicomitatum]
MFENKNILVIAPHFMNYEDEIVSQLKNIGKNVFYYNQRSVTSPIGRAVSKKIPKFFKNHNIKHYQKIFDLITFIPDIILIIQGDMLEKQTMDEFRIQWPKARINLYLWDNLFNIKGVVNKLKWFDNAFSFDDRDSKSNDELTFLPLFFIDKFSENKQSNVNYDLTFIGTIHSDRYKVLIDIEKSMASLGKKIYTFKYLQAKWLFWLYWLIKPEFKKTQRSDFSYKTMEFQELEKIINRSFAVIDIQHPKQSGLTIRTIEMIGMRKKLITTNESIKNYPFYNENNILIIDRNNVNIPDSFFKEDFQPINKEIVDDLRLESWLKKVLLLENENGF